MSRACSEFVEHLRAFRAEAVFNPWSQVDRAFDAGPRAPEIRARQLEAYFCERLRSAELLLIAEAAGYQGAKFSGCAMTSERILLGHLEARGVRAQDVLRIAPERTSRRDAKPLGFNEPTATVVWSSLLAAGAGARSWVNWNAFACHPHRPGQTLTNRTPGPAERDAARPLLERFLQLFSGRTVVAVGRQSAALLTALGVAHRSVRHPSMGGANAFRSQIGAIVEAR